MTKDELLKELEELKSERERLKVLSNSKKLQLNSTFGQLGNRFCSFYSPDLLISITISGQLFLLTIIDRLERIEGVVVRSANTDGLVFTHPPQAIDAIRAVLNDTPFEWEETPYRRIAMRDVNSYVAVGIDGKVKTKGVFGDAGVMQNGNPVFQISATAAARYLADGTPIETTINECDDIRQFVAVRNVTGGGTQHLYTRKVDDWVQVEDRVWRSPSTGKTAKRKSRPKPLEVDAGGKPFGRVARWYRSTKPLKPLSYVASGNKVPDTENARLCLVMPTAFPSDVDKQWYIDRAIGLLADAGVDIGKN